MKPRHFWWLVEAERPKKDKSKLTKADVTRLKRLFDEERAKANVR